MKIIPGLLFYIGMTILLAIAIQSGCTMTTDATVETPLHSFTFNDLGMVIGAELVGVSSGTTIADTSSVLLGDGSIRKYINVNGLGLISATASVSGISFNIEAGIRLPEGSVSHQKVVTLNDGGLRLYTGSGVSGGIVSYHSADGLTFTLEDGVRIATSDTGFAELSHLSVVQLSDDTYRGYFSDLPRPGGGITHYIKSATSTDLLNWEVEDGFRIELGEQPCAFRNSDDSVTLFYFKAQSLEPRLYYATAADGLNFGTEVQSSINGNGPDILQLQNGSYLLYYDTDAENGEFYVGAAVMTVD